MAFDQYPAGPCYNEIYDITEVEPSGEVVITEPVTPTEVKNFCKIDDISEDDDLIDLLITACRQECEDLTNVGFIRREIVVALSNGNGGVYLPLGPVGTISSIVDSSDNDLSESVTYRGSTWKQIVEPRYRDIVITYECGYETLPAVLKRGLLECIFYRYDERKGRESNPVYLETLKPYCRVW